MRNVTLLFLAATLSIAVGTSHAQTWTGLSGPFGGTIIDLAVHPASGAWVIASQGNGLWRSTNNGGSWTRLTVGIDVVFVDLDVDPSGNMYAASSSTRIYRSADGGATWSQLGTGITAGTIISKIRTPSSTTLWAVTTAGVLFRSANSGVSFGQVNTVLTPNIQDLEANGNLVYVISNNRLQYSNDNGATFVTSSSFTGSLANTSLFAYSVALNPTTNRAFVLYSDGPHTSTNGTAWSSIKGGIADASFQGTLELDPGQNLYMTNLMTNVRRVYSGNALGVWNSSTGVLLRPEQQVTCFLPRTATEWILGTQHYGVYRTVDGGSSWTEANSGLKLVSATGIFYTQQNRILLAVGGVGYYESIDEGSTWTIRTSAPLPQGTVRGFVRLSDGSVLAYGSGVFRSTGPTIGNAWTQQSTQALSQIVTFDGINLFGFVGNQLFTSTNQGVTWTLRSVPAITTFINKIQVGHNNDLFISTSNSLFRLPVASTIATVIRGLTSDFTVFASTGNTTIYLLANINTLETSLDGGATWSSRSIISTSANRIWAFRNNVLVMQSPNTSNFFYSRDGGANWTITPLADAEARATDVVLSGSELAYIATANSVAYKSQALIIPPTAPTGLVSVGVSSNQIQVLFNDNSSSESVFELEVSVGNNTNFQVNQRSSAFNTFQQKGRFVVSALAPGTSHFMRVVAKNDAGASAYSNELSVTTLPTCADNTIPNNRSWTVTTVADVGFTPNGPGPFTASNVLINKFSPTTIFADIHANNIVPPTPVPARPFGLEGLQLTINCDQVIVTGNATVNADFSNGNGTWNPATNTLTVKWQAGLQFQPFKATTTYVLNATDPVPFAPGSITPYLYSPTEVLLNWEPVGFETQYRVFRSTVAGGPYTQVATVSYPTNLYIDKNLTPGATYFYALRAVNATGASALSPESTITLGPTLFRPVENDLQLNTDSQQGVSWGDLDGDGDEDLAIASFTASTGLFVPPAFYENTGGGQFTRRILPSLEDENTAISRLINLMDMDNDGDLDVVIARSGVLPSLYLRNNGAWDFTKTPIAESVAPGGVASGFKPLALVDYDKDTFLDLFFGNDFGVPFTLTAVQLKNNGGNSFTRVLAGDFTTDLNGARSFSAADYDNDGDQDILVVNNVTGMPTINEAVRLYRNEGNGSFNRVTGLVFDTDFIMNARTSSWADIDNDQDLDLFIGSQANTILDRLYRNNGNGTFTRVTGSAVEDPGTNVSLTFGSAFGDIDNDGDVDLISINSTANGIFLNNISGTTSTFTKYSTPNPELLQNPFIAEAGGSFADFDKDGFLDFYPAGTGNNFPSLLYKNTTAPSASRNWIAIKLVGTSSNRSAVGARITVVTLAPARTQIREVFSTTGYGAQSSLIQHFGLGSATTITQIAVRWPSGNIQTITNPSFLSPVNREITIVEDVTGPAFTLNPANGAANAPVGNTLEITLSEPSFPVAGRNLVIRQGSATAAPLQTIPVVNGVASAGNKYTFTLATGLQFLTQYFVSIDAGAYTDIYLNPSLAIAPTGWTFTTVEAPDVIPPAITFTPLENIDKNFGPGTKLEVTATDNRGITSLIMNYRKVTRTDFSQATGQFNATTSKYDFALNENTYFDDMGMEYFFEASDAAGNTTRSPSGSGFHLTRKSFPEALVGLSLTASNSVSGYDIITIPHELTTSQVGLVFDELGAPDPREWRLLKYNHEPQQWVEGFQNLARGEGYFAISKNGATIKFGNTRAPSFTQSNLFPLNLKRGFNLIGNPYTVPISWENVRAGVAGVGPLKIFSGGNYVNGDGLNVFEGGFVFSENEVVIPVKFSTTTGGRMGRKELGRDIDATEWLLPLSLQQHDRTFTLGGFGMAQNASENYDGWDDLAPPSPIEVTEIRFRKPLHFMNYFARDVVPTTSMHRWEVDILAQPRAIAQLTWDHPTLGGARSELYLVDRVNEKIIDMRAQGIYSFTPQPNHGFYVYYGYPLADIRPERNHLGAPYPLPSRGEVTIPFSVVGPGTHVLMEIFDLQGKKVATLVNQALPAGFHTATWASEAPNGSGIFFARFTATSPRGADVKSTKIMIQR